MTKVQSSVSGTPETKIITPKTGLVGVKKEKVPIEKKESAKNLSPSLSSVVLLLLSSLFDHIALCTDSQSLTKGDAIRCRFITSQSHSHSALKPKHGWRVMCVTER